MSERLADLVVLGLTLRERVALHPGPYAAAYAAKGEVSDWPWYVYGAQQSNALGVLPDQASAVTLAHAMNRIGGFAP